MPELRSPLPCRFHEVYSGSGINHRVTRLQPDTRYTFRVAAISHSGQGSWSDYVLVKTTPAPPRAPRGLVLIQQSDSLLQMGWEPVRSEYPVVYEVQYRMANANQEYQQVCMDSGYSPPILTL